MNFIRRSTMALVLTLCLSAGLMAQSATVTWQQPAQPSGEVISSTNLYRDAVKFVTGIPATTLSYLDTAVADGVSYVYSLTNVDTNGVESVASASVTGTIPVVTPPPPVTITITPTASSVLEGGTVAFSDVVTGTTNTAVTWSANAPLGLFTAPLVAGTAVVTVTTVATPAVSASATVTITAPVLPGCTTSSTAWKNTAFVAPTGSYVVTYNVTPSQLKMDGVVGLGSAAITTYGNSAVTTRFYTDGFIEAISGAGYATSTITYVAGTQYQFTLNINPTARTYSAYVTAAGGAQQTIGTNLAFRTGTSTAALLDYGIVDITGTESVCNFVVSAGTPIVAITIAPVAPSIVEGGTVLFTGVVTGSTNTAVTWSANAPNGLYTAPLVAGTAVVTVTSVATPTVSASATVTTTAPPQSMTTVGAFLSDGVTWQTNTVTVNVPAGQAVKSVVTSGALSNTATGTHP